MQCWHRVIRAVGLMSGYGPRVGPDLNVKGATTSKETVPNGAVYFRFERQRRGFSR